jgi:NhaP-type Na+/H+ or K+/H+ antiporter
MLKLMEEGYGKANSIPQMILAGASVDDVFVIVLFTSLTGLAQGEGVTAWSFIKVPMAIILGALAGILCGKGLALLFQRIHMRDSAKVIIILSISFLLVVFEEAVPEMLGFSGLIAVMTCGISLQQHRFELATRLSLKYSKLWVAAELLLFVLVGATVNLSYALAFGSIAVGLIFFVLLFRMLGVFLCLIKTRLSNMEKLFCMVAYCPKATVQAAIGSIPLGLGLPCLFSPLPFCPF